MAEIASGEDVWRSNRGGRKGGRGKTKASEPPPPFKPVQLATLVDHAAANTPDAALRKIAGLAGGYTYCVTRPGITGTHTQARFDPALIDRLRHLGAPPPVFGFGISTPDHVRAALDAGAAGVICGSAIVSRVAGAVSPATAVAPFVASLKAATRTSSSRLRNDCRAQAV